MLLDDIDRLEIENVEFKDFREQYYQADRRCAVLEEGKKTSTAYEILSYVCLAVGSGALGFAPNLWDHQPSGWVCIIFGGVLIVGGVAAKAVRR
jgi:hypothetical protein